MNSVFRKSSLFVFVAVIAVMGFALAAHVVTTSTIGIDFGTANEDVSTKYNFTVNNTDLIGSNVTEVNITLPAGFTFFFNVTGMNGTNWTSAGIHIFSNTSNVLTWANITIGTGGLIENGTSKSFSFNATAATPGVYNFTVTVRNATGTTTSSSVNVTINDTTIPSALAFDSSTPGAFTNRTGPDGNSSIFFNVTVTDNGLPSTVRFLLFNASGAGLYTNNVNYSINVTISGNSSWFNFTDLVDGTYTIFAVANDTRGNLNTTGVNRTVTIDTSDPGVTLTRSGSSTKYTLIVDIALSDGTSGISGACSGDRQNGVITGAGTTSQTYTENNLECGHSYALVVTCNDHASNSGSASGTFSTDSCGGSGGSGGGSGSSGGSGTTSWTATYSHDTQEFSQVGSLSRILSANQRVKIKVNSETHYVGIVSVSSNGATVQVSSTPQEATLNVGESKNFELTGDNYYDVKATLNSVENGKASVTIESIQEQMPQPSPAAAEEQNTTGEQVDSVSSSSSKWIWIVVAIVVIIIIVALYLKKKK